MSTVSCSTPPGAPAPWDEWHQPTGVDLEVMDVSRNGAVERTAADAVSRRAGPWLYRMDECVQQIAHLHILKLRCGAGAVVAVAIDRGTIPCCP